MSQNHEGRRWARRSGRRPWLGVLAGMVTLAAVVVPTGSATANATTPDTYTDISWAGAAPSPVARLEANAAVVGDRLFVLGGYVKRFNPDARSDVYDPATDAWTRIADMPAPTTHGGVAVVGTDIYIAGGYIAKPGGGQIFATTAVWRYDTVADTWSSMPPLPSARGAGGLVAVGRTLYFFGGATLHRAEKGTNWMLNLDAPTKWIARAPLPHVRTHFGTAVLNGLVYAIGGEIGHDSGAVVNDIVDVYDPVANAWSPGVPLPKPRAHISASTVVSGGRVIVFGGDSPASTPIADVTAYTPGAAQWQELTPMPVGRYAGVAAAFSSGELFFTTGMPRTGVSWQGTPVTGGA